MKCISESSISAWQQSADLVVAGFGMAGACAASSACEQGGSVLVFERGSGVNGSATQAAGHFYLGGGSRPQLANDLNDSADEKYNYLHALTPEPENKNRLYYDDSVKHFNWLIDQGIPFNNGFYKRKHVEQPTDECLIWSGNEKVWPYSQQATPCPRGYKVAVEGSGGALAIQRLLQKTEQADVAIAYDTDVTALVKDADRGDDTGMHKHSGWLQILSDPPFGALQCSKGEATYAGFALDGLKVSANAQVLSATGQSIADLYAAGACASNIAQDSNGYASGTCLGESSYFGRRAGYHAVNARAMS